MIASTGKIIFLHKLKYYIGIFILSIGVTLFGQTPDSDLSRVQNELPNTQSVMVIGNAGTSDQSVNHLNSFDELKTLPAGEYYVLAQDISQMDIPGDGNGERVVIKNSAWDEYYLLGGFVLSVFLLTIGYLLLRYIRLRKKVYSLTQAIREKTNKIRKLNLEILITEEKQRQHIATEFHDRVAQYLAMAKIKLGSINQIASDSHYAEAISEAYQLVDRSIKDTRLLIRELNPPVLRELNIGGAIVWLVDQVKDNYQLDARINNLLSPEQTKAMDMETQTILFQSTREILNNVIKHAHAESVDVDIWSEDNMLWIRVEDDGIGFQNPKAESDSSNGEGGYGLVNIRERLKQIDGQFEIEYEPGVGTRVKFAAPLRLNEMHQQSE
jgi:signal transduction histidine kinase